MNEFLIGLIGSLLYFYRCLHSGASPAAVTLGEETNASRTALAIIESARTSHEVELHEWNPVQ